MLFPKAAQPCLNGWNSHQAMSRNERGMPLLSSKVRAPRETRQAHSVQGCGPMQYPPVSVEKAVQALFLTGATGRTAWRAKLAMLVYYLLDADLAFPEPSFM